MDEAVKKMKSLSLSEFPGENVSKFSNEAQRLLKIMKGGYALPYQLGSEILEKVCTTQSLYFNRSMFNLLDHAFDLEKNHGPHRDPKLLGIIDSLSRLHQVEGMHLKLAGKLCWQIGVWELRERAPPRIEGG